MSSSPFKIFKNFHKKKTEQIALLRLFLTHVRENGLTFPITRTSVH